MCYKNKSSLLFDREEKLAGEISLRQRSHKIAARTVERVLREGLKEQVDLVMFSAALEAYRKCKYGATIQTSLDTADIDAVASKMKAIGVVLSAERYKAQAEHDSAEPAVQQSAFATAGAV